MTRSRKDCVSGLTCAPRTFREALHCQVVHHPTVRTDDVAEDRGMHPRTLMAAVNPDASDWLALRHLEPVLALTQGHTPVLDYLARHQGGLFVPVPTATSVNTAMADEVCAFGAYLRARAEAEADAKITPDELADIEQQAWRAMQAIAGGLEAARAAVRLRRVGSR